MGTRSLDKPHLALRKRRGGPGRAARSAQSRRASRTGALLVSPAVALIVVFVLFPLGYAVYISLTNWPLLGPYHFIGLANYKELWHDSGFKHSIIFTLTYTAIVTPPIFIVGYGLAALLRTEPLRRQDTSGPSSSCRSSSD